MNRTEFLELVEKNTKESNKNYPANYAATSIVLEYNKTLKNPELHEKPNVNYPMYDGILKTIVQSQYDLLKIVQQTL